MSLTRPLFCAGIDDVLPLIETLLSEDMNSLPEGKGVAPKFITITRRMMHRGPWLQLYGKGFDLGYFTAQVEPQIEECNISFVCIPSHLQNYGLDTSTNS